MIMSILHNLKINVADLELVGYYLDGETCSIRDSNGEVILVTGWLGSHPGDKVWFIDGVDSGSLTGRENRTLDLVLERLPENEQLELLSELGWDVSGFRYTV